MASWIKVQPENTDQLMVGRTYLHELGRTEFKWVIQNFRDLLLLGDPIR
jgi:hypothetical protein